jgi:hypothetical protein
MKIQHIKIGGCSKNSAHREIDSKKKKKKAYVRKFSTQ